MVQLKSNVDFYSIFLNEFPAYFGKYWNLIYSIEWDSSMEFTFFPPTEIRTFLREKWLILFRSKTQKKHLLGS